MSTFQHFNVSTFQHFNFFTFSTFPLLILCNISELKTFKIKKDDLFGDLNPKDWPISIDDLPPGSALVGGSVRDGLLKKLSPKPDLDFVIPVNAIKFSENLSKKIHATFIKLDEKRDIANSMDQKLTEWLDSIEHRDTEAHEAEFDDEVREELEKLGYL